MAFGTTNYPVFVEFELNGGGKVSLALNQMVGITETPIKDTTKIYLNGEICITVKSSYSETIQKIKSKIPKPAKWPPAIESKKDDSIPPQNTYPRSGDSHRLF